MRQWWEGGMHRFRRIFLLARSQWIGPWPYWMNPMTAWSIESGIPRFYKSGKGSWIDGMIILQDLIWGLDMTLKATLYNNVPGPELVHCSYIASVWKKYLRPSCRFAEVLDVTTKVPIFKRRSWDWREATKTEEGGLKGLRECNCTVYSYTVVFQMYMFRSLGL